MQLQILSFAPGRGAEYCDQRVCMFAFVSVCFSVCQLTYLKNHMSNLHAILSTCYVWSCLDPLLTTMQYVMSVWFCGWRHVCT